MYGDTEIKLRGGNIGDITINTQYAAVWKESNQLPQYYFDLITL